MDPFLGWGDELFLATTMTIRVALGGVVLGLLWGIIGASAKLSKHPLPRILGDAYTTVIRGVPELLIILIIYFGGTVTVTGIYKYFSGSTEFFEVPAMAAGIFALSLVFGAYSAEVFRGAILAIPVGQIEAAKAIGMHSWMIFWDVKLPQLWRFALPGLGNHWLSLVKDTALISVVGLEEIMRVSYMATSVTNEPFRFYFCATVIYLFLNAINSRILQALENRANRGVRRV
jgi:putative lysine/arginine/ornithine/histidine/octopine transport system permease protein